MQFKPGDIGRPLYILVNVTLQVSQWLKSRHVWLTADTETTVLFPHLTDPTLLGNIYIWIGSSGIRKASHIPACISSAILDRDQTLIGQSIGMNQVRGMGIDSEKFSVATVNWGVMSDWTDIQVGQVEFQIKEFAFHLLVNDAPPKLFNIEVWSCLCFRQIIFVAVW